MKQLAEKKVLEAELEFERLSKKQEVWKREKEITEHKRELESVKQELEQNLPAMQKV